MMKQESATIMTPKLEKEWIDFCKRTYSEWSKENPSGPIYIWNPVRTFENFYERKDRWKEFIRIRGNEWWKNRGFKAIWPDDEKLPLQVKKIEEA